MDLKEFIRNTLTQIAEGAAEAQANISALGGEVAPSINTGTYMELGKHGLLSTDKGYAHMVDFDVALTTSEGTGTKGGIGVFLGVATLGSGGESKSESSSLSRIKFSIPITLKNLKSNN